MANKMGRPTENPRTVQTRIRMNQQESEKLEYCAKKLNKSKTDIVVLGIEKVYSEIKE